MIYEVAIPILTFLAVIAIGGAVVAARSARRRALAARLDTRATVTLEDGLQEGWLTLLLKRLGARVAPGGPSKGLRDRLTQAGYSAPACVPLFLGAKVGLLVLGLAVALPLILPTDMSVALKALAVVGLAAMMSWLPDVVVSGRRKKRTMIVRHHLPDAIDLLEVNVTSGMGLDTAWNAVGGEIRRVCPVLADEMALTALEIQLGAERAPAMRHMAERTGANELSSLVAVLVQSEKLGTTVSEALRSFAQSMRELRTQRAEEGAEKMAVKLLFPMVVFVFPAILLVCAGPAGLRIVRLFSGN